MKISQLYKDIMNRRELWDYYNKDINNPIITDVNDCYRFITEYIKYSEKSEALLFKNVKKLKDDSPQRLSHIVSTFFLGLWFYHHKKPTYLHRSITAFTVLNTDKRLKLFILKKVFYTAVFQYINSPHIKNIAYFFKRNQILPFVFPNHIFRRHFLHFCHHIQNHGFAQRL